MYASSCLWTKDRGYLVLTRQFVANRLQCFLLCTVAEEEATRVAGSPKSAPEEGVGKCGRRLQPLAIKCDCHLGSARMRANGWPVVAYPTTQLQ